MAHALIWKNLRGNAPNSGTRKWLGDPEGQSKPLYDGTLASLIDCYQRNPESGYHGLSSNTPEGEEDFDGQKTTSVHGRRRSA
jgi:hypothetical protein